MSNASDQPVTRTGLGVMIVKDGMVLVGRRKGSHGEGEFAFPGGHLEYMESFEQSARREILEETGLEVDNFRLLAVSNLKKYAPKHYTDIGLLADWKSGEPKVMEPEKIESWDWMPVDDIPHPRFGCMDNYIEAYKGGRNYFDA